jgi:hypothetical protein
MVYCGKNRVNVFFTEFARRRTCPPLTLRLPGIPFPPDTRPFLPRSLCGVFFADRSEILHRFPWLRHIFADGSYAGDKLKDALRRIGQSAIAIIKRSDAASGFEVLPRRWVVERTLA